MFTDKQRLLTFSILLLGLAIISISDSAEGVSPRPGGPSGQDANEVPFDPDPGDDIGDTAHALVLLIQFPDYPADAVNHTPEFFEDLLFNYSSGSMWDYYRENSYGEFNVTGDVVGWLNASYNMSEYGSVYGNSSVANLTREALEQASAQLNYSHYDKDGDGDLDYLIMVHSGLAQESYPWMEELIWSHASYIPTVQYNNTNISRYNIQGEYTPMGTFAHEFGHLLGLPDLYTSPSNLGSWGLMGSGNWNGNPQGSSPAHLSAWSKMQLGWLTPTELSGDLYNITIPQIEDNDVAYRLSLEHVNDGDPDEYFLIVNRQQWGYDSALPGSGLLIWHIDNDAGKVILEKNGAWYNDATGFTAHTTPNSNSYGGQDSGYSVEQISLAGYNMTFVVIREESEWSFGNIHGSALSADGEYILAGRYGSNTNNKIYFFSVSSNAPLWSYETGSGQTLRYAAISSNGSYGIVASEKTAYFFDLASGDEEPLWEWSDSTTYIRDVAISPNGEYATVIYSGIMYVFHRSSNDALWDVYAGWEGQPIFTADGKYIAYTYSNDQVYYYETATGSLLFTIDTDIDITGNSEYEHMAMSSDGRYIAVITGCSSSCGSDAVVLVDATEREVMWTFEVEGTYIRDVDISDNGEYVAFGTSSGDDDSDRYNVYYVRVSDGQVLWQFHTYADVKQVIISGDGQFVMAATYNGYYQGEKRLLVWDAFNETLIRNEYTGRNPQLLSASMSVDGARYIMVESGTFHLYKNHHASRPYIQTFGSTLKLPNPPTVSWIATGHDPANMTFDIYADNNSSPTTLVATNISGTNYTIGGLLEGETYYWKVVARDISGSYPSVTRSFRINGPPTVTLSYPADGAVWYADRTLIEWSATDPEDDTLSYWVYIDTEDDPTTLLCTTQTTICTKTGLQENQEYNWKVKAWDGVNYTWSDTWSFDVVGMSEDWKSGTGSGIAEISVSGDGQYIVAGSNAGKVELREYDDDDPIWDYDTGTIYDVAISQDGRYFAGVGGYGLYLFSTNISETGADPYLLWSNTTTSYNDLAISADGSYIVACRYDKMAFFHRSSSTALWTNNLGCYDVVISADGLYVAAADYWLYLYHTGSGIPLWKTSQTFDDRYDNVDISADGSFIVACGPNSVYAYHRSSSEEIFYYSIGYYAETIDISDDGHYFSLWDGYYVQFFSLSQEGGEFLWSKSWYDPDTGRAQVDVNADGSYVTAVNYGQGIRYYDREGNLLWDHDDNDGYYRRVSLSDDGRVVTVGRNCCSESNILTYTWSYAPSHLFLPLAPETGALTDRNVSLQWATAGEEVEDWVYDVYVGTSPDLTTPVRTNFTLRNYTASNLAREVTYYWKVVLKDENGDILNSTDVRSFTVREVSAIALQSPAINFVRYTADVDLFWSGTEGLVYLAYLGISPGGLDPQTNTWQSEDRITVSGLDLNFTYYWQVYAFDGSDFLISPLRTITLVEHPPIWAHKASGNLEVTATSISEDGNFSAVGYNNGDLKLFGRYNSTPLWSYGEIDDDITSVSLSANGSYLAVVSDDEHIYLFSRENSTPLWNYDAGANLNTVAISADGEYIVIGGNNKKVSLFERSDNVPLWTTVTLSGYVDTVAISETGNYIVAGLRSGGGGRVYMFTNSGDGDWEWYDTVGGHVHALDISADGQHITAGSRDDKVYFYNRTSDDPIWEYLTGDEVHTLSLSADGSMMAAVSNDGIIHLFDTSSSEPQWSYSSGTTIRSVAISANGNYVVAGGDNEYLYYFDRNSSLFIWRVNTGSDIEHVTLSTSGDYILVGEEDGTSSLFGSPYLKRAYISSSPTGFIQFGDDANFSGYVDDAANVTAYVWTSNIDGLLSTNRTFSTTTLSEGSHSITFEARYNASVTYPTYSAQADNDTWAVWRFDEESGNYAYDISGNDRHVYLYGPTWNTAGRAGSALSFDGNNDYVRTQSWPAGGAPDEFTIEAWVKLDDYISSGNPQVIYAMGIGPAYLRVNSDEKLYFSTYCSSSCGGSSNQYLTGSTALVPGVWYHVAAVFSESQDSMAVYLNGTLDNNLTLPSSYNLYYWGNFEYIGYGNWWSSNYFDGLIDEVRVSDTARTSFQLTSNFSVQMWTHPAVVSFRVNAVPLIDRIAVTPGVMQEYGPTGLPGVDEHTLAWWRMDEGSGTTVSDETGAHDGWFSDNDNPTWTDGRFGNAVDFEEDYGEYVGLPNDGWSMNGGGYTVEAWIRLESTGRNHGIYRNMQNSDQDFPNVAFGVLSSNSLRFYVYFNYLCGSSTCTTTMFVASPNNQFVADEWYHVAGTIDVDSRKLQIYVNGQLVDEATIPGSYSLGIADCCNDHRIGDPANWFSYFDGTIDELRISSIALEPDNFLVRELEKIVLQATAHDIDGSIVNYTWLSDMDGAFGYGPYIETNVTGLLSPGHHNITVRVRDNDGREVVSTAVQFYLKGIPVANITSISPSSTTEGITISFSGSATDYEGVSSYEWSSSIDGVLSSSASFSSSSLSPGYHNITFRARDSDGYWSFKVNQTIFINDIPKVDAYRFPIPVIHGDGDSEIYSRAITLSSGTTVANHPVRIDLTSANFNYAHSTSDGSDIRFTDEDENSLSYWIESWSYGGTSIVWVSLPEVGTRNFTLLYGTTSAIASNVDSNMLQYLSDSYPNYSGWSNGVPWSCYVPGSSLPGYEQWMLGGYNQFGFEDYTQKTIPSLPAGEYQISFKFYAVDRWNNEYGRLYWNDEDGDERIWSENFPGSNTERNYCGNVGYNDANVKGETRAVTATHSGGNATLKFTSTLDEDSDLESWGVDAIRVRIIDNPSGLTVTIGDEVAEVFRNATFTALVDDTYGTITNYTWHSSKDGYLGYTRSFTLPVTNLTLGSHTLSLRVKDSYGIWSEYENITMLVLHFPNVTSMSVSQQMGDELDRIWFNGTGSDSYDNGTLVSYEWYSSIDGLLSSTTSFNTTALSYGNHTISFRVKDNTSLWSVRWYSWVYINDLPDISIDAVYPNPVYRDGIISGDIGNNTLGLWRFDIGNGTVAGDSSGDNFDGTLQNFDDNDEPYWVLGKSGFALHFDGSNDYVSLPDITDTPSEVTVEAWIWLDGGVSNRMTILELNDDARLWFYLDSNERIALYVDGNYGSRTVTGSTSLVPGVWYHVAGVYSENDDELRVYVNTTLDGTYTIPSDFYMYSRDRENTIGYNHYHGYQRFNGIIDEVRVSEDTLTKLDFLYDWTHVVFNGSATDIAGYVANYTWTSSIDGLLSNQANFTVSIDSLSLGNHTITFRARDEVNAWSVPLTMVLRVYAYPVANITDLGPLFTNTGDQVNFSGSAVAPNSTIVAYQWWSSLDGIINTNATFDTTSLSYGNHTIIFRGRNADGLWSSPVQGWVMVNDIPTAIINDITPYISRQGEGQRPPADSKTIGYWPFIEGSGTATWDESGQMNNATLHLGAEFDEDGKWGPGVYFDGSDDYIYVNEGDAISNLGGADFTLEAWIMPDGTVSGIRSIIRNDGDYNLMLTSGYLMAQVVVGNTKYYALGDTQISTGDWYHVAAVWDASEYEWTLYVNGQEEDETSDTSDWGDSADYPLWIGNSDYNQGNHPFKGVIDEVRISNSMRSSLTLLYDEVPQTTISFDGSGTDNDGTILAYQWRSSLNGDLSISDEFTFSAGNLAVGTHTISLRVKDDDGVWSPWETDDIIVRAYPTANITSVSPNSTSEGNLVSFNSIASDPDVNQTFATYRWRSSIDGFLSDQITFNTTLLTPGNHTIYLNVKDEDGYWSLPVSTPLFINDIPEAFITNLTPSSGYRNNQTYLTVTFNGMVIDNDGTITDYYWNSTLEGNLSTSSSFEFNVSSLRIGNHTITYQGKDDYGVWSPQVVYYLQVYENPNTTAISVSIQSTYEGIAINFSGGGSDADGNITAYEWRSSIDGIFGNSSSVTNNSLSSGYHTIRFKVRDDDGLWSDDAQSYVFINDVPDVNITSISPQVFYKNNATSTIITFNATAFDSDGNITTYRWTSSKDGLIGILQNFTFDISCWGCDLTFGNHTITFQVRDNFSTWSPESTSYLIVKAYPNATIDSITPTFSNESSHVYMNGTASDEDGNITGYQWVSSIDGLIGTLRDISLNTLTPGNHTIYFKAKDNDSLWSVADTLNITVNARPQVSVIATIPEIIFGNSGNNAVPTTDSYTIGYWHFDEGSGSTVYDSSGRNKHGSLMAGYSRTDGLFEGGIALDGDNHGRIGIPELVSGVFSELTIEAWIKLAGEVPDNDDFMVYAGGKDGILEVGINDDQYFYFKARDATFGLKTVIGSTTIVPGSWYHVAATYSAGDDEMKIYVNWQLDGNISIPTNFVLDRYASGGNCIGSGSGCSGDYFDGAIDEVRISDKVRNVAEFIARTDATYLSAIPTDADGSIVLVEWRSNISGLLSRENWALVNTTILSAGDHNISFRAKDAYGFWSQYVYTSFKVKTHPGASILSVSPSSTVEGTMITFNATSSDEDGSVVEYEWKSSRDGVFGDVQNLTSSSLSVGYHQITFRVMDDDNLWSVQSFAHLYINSIPTAQIDGITPQIAYKNNLTSTTGTFSGSVSDNDGSITHYFWNSSKNGILSKSGNFTYNLSNLQVGNHTIYFQGRDNYTTWSPVVTTWLQVKAYPNATIDSISPQFVNETKVVNMFGSGSDEDGNTIEYRWFSDLDGLIGDLKNISISSLSPGNHTISFKTKDNDSLWSTAAISWVLVNGKPVVTITAIIPPEIYGFSGNDSVPAADQYDLGYWHLDEEAGSTAYDSSGRGKHADLQGGSDWDDGIFGGGVFLDGDDGAIEIPRLFSGSTRFSEVTVEMWFYFDAYVEDGEVSILFGGGKDGTLEMGINDAQEPYIKVSGPGFSPRTATSDGALSTGRWYHVAGTYSEVDDSIQLYVNREAVGSESLPSSFSLGYQADDSCVGARAGCDGSHIEGVIDEIRISAMVRSSSEFIHRSDVAYVSGVAIDPENSISEVQWISELDGHYEYLSFDAWFTVNTTQLEAGNHTIIFRAKDSIGVWSDNVTVSLHIRFHPEAEIVSISPNSTRKGVSVNLIGSSSDSDGSVESYEWKSSIDGVFAQTQNTTISSLSRGLHQITFKVRDDDALWSVTTISTLYIDAEPDAYITSVTPDPAYKYNVTSTIVNFAGYVDDAESEVEIFRWNSTLNGVIIVLGTNQNITYDINNLSVGDHNITFQGRDDFGSWSNMAYTYLIIKANPTSEIIYVSTNSTDEGTPITFRGQGNDEDGHIVTYEWRSSIDDIFSRSDDVEISHLSPGDHNITFKARDNDGVWSSPVEVQVHINSIPDVAIDSITPSESVYHNDLNGTQIMFNGSFEDSDGYAVDFEWISSLDGMLSNTSSFTYQIPSLSVGVHMISFRGQDDSGTWSSSVSVVLYVGAYPNGSIVSVSSSFVNEDQSITFNGTADDEDGEVVEYAWYSSIVGRISTYGNFSIDFLPPGTHEITFKVKDDEGLWSAGEQWNITINALPRVELVSVTPSTVYAYGPFSDVTPPDEFTLGYWHFNESSGVTTKDSGPNEFDGTLIDDATFGTGLFNNALYLDGEYDAVSIPSLLQGTTTFTEVTLEAWIFLDGDNNEDQVILSGGTDGLFEFGVDSDNKVYFKVWSSTLGVKHVSSSVSLPSGHWYHAAATYSEGYEIKLYLNGVRQETLDLEPTFHLQQTATPNCIGARATCGESFFKGQIDELRITNRILPPSNFVSRPDVTYLAAVVTDSDSEIVAYQWYSDIDGYLPGSQQAFLLQASALTPGQHVITFRARDQYGAWSYDETSPLYVRTYPVATILGVDNIAPIEGDNVTFTGFAEDFDGGQIIGYEWRSSVDGILGYEKNLTVSTLSYGNHTIFYRGEDDTGFWSLWTSIDIHVDPRPIGTIMSYPYLINDNQTAVFTSESSDVYGREIIAYAWNSDLDDLIGEAANFTATNLSVGNHTIVLLIQNSDGVWSFPDEVQLRVNSRPISLISEVWQNSTTGEVILNGSGIDIDGVITGYEWFSDVDGYIGNQTLLSRYNLSNGTHNISLVVTDDSGGQSPPVINILFVNGDPYLVYSNISSTKILRGDVVEILLEAFDDTNPQSNLTVEIQSNDTTGGWGNTYLELPEFEDGYWNAHFVPPLDAVLGNYDIRVRVSESGARQSSWIVIETVEVLNNLPQVLDFEMGNDTVERGLSTPIWFMASDRESPDNHTNLVIQVSYTQQVFAIYQEIDYLGPVYYNASRDKFEVWFTPDIYASLGIYSISIRVQDPDGGDSGWVEYNAIVGVVNRKPVLMAYLGESGQSFVQSKDTLWLNASAIDYDGPDESLRYEWVSDRDGLLGCFTATCEIDPSDLKVGEHVIRLKVQDDMFGTSESFVFNLTVVESPNVQEGTFFERYLEGNLAVLGGMLLLGTLMIATTLWYSRREEQEEFIIETLPREGTKSWLPPVNLKDHEETLAEFFAKRREAYLKWPNNEEMLDYLHNNRERFAITSYFEVPVSPAYILQEWALPQNLRYNVHLDEVRKSIVNTILDDTKGTNFVIIGEPGVGKTTLMFDVFDRLMDFTPVGRIITPSAGNIHEKFGIRIFYDDIPENPELVNVLMDRKINGMVITSRESDWQGLPKEFQDMFQRLTVPLFSEEDMYPLSANMLSFSGLGYEKKALDKLTVFSEGSPIYVWSMIRELVHQNISKLTLTYLNENSMKGMTNYVSILLQGLLKDGSEFREGGYHALTSLVFLSEFVDEKQSHELFFRSVAELLSPHTKEVFGDEIETMTFNQTMGYLSGEGSRIRFPHDTWADVLKGIGTLNPFRAEIQMIHKEFNDTGLFEKLRKEAVPSAWETALNRYQRSPSRYKETLLELADTLFRNFTLSELKDLSVDYDLVLEVATTYSHLPLAALLVSKIQAARPQQVTKIINVQDSVGTPTTFGGETTHPPYTIEGLNLIYNDGRLITSVSSKETTMDSEIMSSMLTAINDFVQDSFQSEGFLGSIDYGDSKIILEKGKYSILTSSVYGEITRDLRSRMASLVTKIEEDYNDTLDGWDGDHSQFGGITERLNASMKTTEGVTRVMIDDYLSMQEVRLRRDWDMVEGLIKVNIQINNYSSIAITDVILGMEYNKSQLKLEKVEPDFEFDSLKVQLGEIGGNRETIISLFFRPLQGSALSLSARLDYTNPRNEGARLALPLLENVDLATGPSEEEPSREEELPPEEAPSPEVTDDLMDELQKKLDDLDDN